MATFHLRTSFALLVLGFVLGFFTTTLFHGCGKVPASKIELPAAKPQQLSKQATDLQKSYQDEIAKLQDENFELQQELEVTDGLLQQAKQTTFEQEKKISGSSLFLKSFPAHDLSFKLKPFSPLPIPDRTACDSLTNEVNLYIQANHRKDSLYEQQIFQFDSVISVKDALLQAGDKAYGNLNSLFGQSLTAQQTLIQENVVLKKKVKAQKTKGKLLALGGIVLSGLAADFLLHH